MADLGEGRGEDEVLEDDLEDEVIGDDELWGVDEPPEELFDNENGFPCHGYLYGQPIPVLRLIPRERWRAALAPLRPKVRTAAADTVEYKDISEVLALIGDLMIADGEARHAARSTPSPAIAAGSPPGATRQFGTRQINFRISADQYERLGRAAALYGMRPGTLARAMTMSGVERALYEERRVREGA